MGDLSCVLNSSNIGGRIRGEIEHSLSYNTNMSYSLCFKATGTTIKFERPAATLHIVQINIPNVTDCRYLGITISVKKTVI